jgi:hypothetical protein
VEEDVPADPVHIGDLGAPTVMASADRLAHTVEQPGLGWARGRRLADPEPRGD